MCNWAPAGRGLQATLSSPPPHAAIAPSKRTTRPSIPSNRRTLLPAMCASPTTLSASVTSLITSSSLKARIAKSSDPASSSSLPTFARGVQLSKFAHFMGGEKCNILVWSWYSYGGVAVACRMSYIPGLHASF